jgi:hypothetical protein
MRKPHQTFRSDGQKKTHSSSPAIPPKSPRIPKETEEVSDERLRQRVLDLYDLSR